MKKIIKLNIGLIILLAIFSSCKNNKQTVKVYYNNFYSLYLPSSGSGRYQLVTGKPFNFYDSPESYGFCEVRNDSLILESKEKYFKIMVINHVDTLNRGIIKLKNYNRGINCDLVDNFYKLIINKTDTLTIDCDTYCYTLNISKLKDTNNVEMLNGNNHKSFPLNITRTMLLNMDIEIPKSITKRPNYIELNNFTLTINDSTLNFVNGIYFIKEDYDSLKKILLPYKLVEENISIKNFRLRSKYDNRFPPVQSCCGSN
jgi:hypothetical protein